MKKGNYSEHIEINNVSLKNDKAITLIALVITIVILIILAGVSIHFALGKNGLITKAQEAAQLQKLAEIKEKIGTEILDAETDAALRGENVEQSQIEDIILKYGKLQEDGDTIILKNPKDMQVKLSEIYSGEISSTGSYTGNKEKIKELETTIAEKDAQIASLGQQLDEALNVKKGKFILAIGNNGNAGHGTIQFASDYITSATQTQVGTSTNNWASSFRIVMKQDCTVILMGGRWTIYKW